MTHPFRSFFAIATLLLCLRFAPGADGIKGASPALVFASPSVEAVNDLIKQVAVAHISFKNVSGHKIALTPVKPSCSCMSIVLDSNVYAPGEEGVVLFTNTFEKREGSATKTIVLTSDETPPISYKIEILVRFPPRDDMQGTVVDFDRSVSLDQKKIDIKIGDPADPLDTIDAKVDFPVAKAEVYTLVPGLYYQLGITPQISGTSYTCKVTISMHSPKRKFREYVVYVHVK